MLLTYEHRAENADIDHVCFEQAKYALREYTQTLGKTRITRNARQRNR